jgi:hypothetical protein
MYIARSRWRWFQDHDPVEDYCCGIVPALIPYLNIALGLIFLGAFIWHRYLRHFFGYPRIAAIADIQERKEVIQEKKLQPVKETKPIRSRFDILDM